MNKKMRTDDKGEILNEITEILKIVYLMKKS